MACFDEGAKMRLNKKGYMITPLIFVVFMIITIVFTYYVSNIDFEMSESIHTSAMIEKTVSDLREQRINQINYAKMAAYNWSNHPMHQFNASSSNRGLENRIEEEMDLKFGESNWKIKLTSELEGVFLEISLPEIRIDKTDITVLDPEFSTKELLSSQFLNYT